MREEKPKNNSQPPSNSQTEAALLERYFESTCENQLLRGQNKHVIKLGVIKLEILPTSTDSLKEVVKEFTKFAKVMQKLHGDSHLIENNRGDELSSQLMDQMVG